MNWLILILAALSLDYQTAEGTHYDTWATVGYWVAAIWAVLWVLAMIRVVFD